MALVLVAIMTTALVQEAPHEWLGVTLFVLMAIHIVLNRKWLASIFRGHHSALRIVQIVVIVGLAACIIGQFASSLVLSKHAFGFLPAFPGAGWARSVHMLCSYWAARFRPCGTARESAEEHGAMAEMGGPHHHRGRGMFRGVLVRTTRLVAIPHGSGPVCFRRLQRPLRARIRPLRERRGAGGGCFPLRSTGNCIYRKDKIARLAVAFAPKRMARER